MKKTVLEKLKDSISLYEKYNVKNIYLAGSYARWE